MDYLFNISTTSTTILKKVPPGFKRTQLLFQNLSASNNITISKLNDNATIVGRGINLLAGATGVGGTYLESSDGTFTCWQGEIQIISSANENNVLAVTEIIEQM